MIKKIYRKIIDNMNDEIIITYHYIKKFKKLPNKKDPKSFSDKIHRIKISNWLLDKSDFVDKYKVREYIKEKIGVEYLTKLYGVYKNIEDINFENLPHSFVLKLNNGSGFNLIVKDKSKINEKEVKDKLKMWLKSDFYKYTREKQYKNVEQVIVCEEYLDDGTGTLKDYKFFVLGGKVRIIQVDIDRFGEQKRNFYDTNWNLTEIRSMGMKNSNEIIEKPERLEEMIVLAEKLAKGIELLRVDFYYVEGKIYFGELTFTPADGMKPFIPESADLKLASYVDLSKYNLGD